MRFLLATAAAGLLAGGGTAAAQVSAVEISIAGEELDGPGVVLGSATLAEAFEIFEFTLEGKRATQAGSGRARARTQYGPLAFTKVNDDSTPALFDALAKGTKVEVTVTTSTADPLTGQRDARTQFEATDAFITAVRFRSDTLDQMPDMVDVEVSWGELMISDLVESTEVVISGSINR